MLRDSYGRILNYLRLAVTDRCNLRCMYCMPKEGLNWLPRKESMSDEEMLKICSLFVQMGVEKIRITGGEPFVRKGILAFLEKLSRLKGLRHLTLTTNGMLTESMVPDLKKMGIRSLNLSLDTLDKNRFIQITRRDGLEKVLRTLDRLLEYGMDVKINTVVMENHNISDIIPLVQLTKILPVSVRFIEEMPFNGGGHTAALHWNDKRIVEHIQDYFPAIEKIPDARHSTSFNYHIPGHKGDVGVIAAYSRLFCGSCNRIRVTPTGVIRTCLYDAGKINIKDAVREGKSDEELKEIIAETILKKPKDGWEAQKGLLARHKENESMAHIGG